MFLRKPFERSPIAARVLPFAVFLVLTFAQGQFGEASRYWFYLAKTLAGAWLLWEMRPFVSEMRCAFSWEAVIVGAGVAVLWIGLDGWYPRLGELSVKLGLAKPAATPAAWNPHVQFGQGAALAWFFIAVRILGASLVVPALEEVFFRSFLYRYFARADFQSVALGQFLPLPFFAVSAVFALEHQEWLAGLLCGFAYQGLVIWKQRLGDAIVAHGITNFLLGLWVVGKGAWRFW
jgi:CAAX prenyl protease-like protein